MNKNVMKKMMMVGAMCVALCGSSFAGSNRNMVVQSDKHQVRQHQVQQQKVQQQKKYVVRKKQQAHQRKHVVKQKQVVVVQKGRYHDQRCCVNADRRAAGAALLGAVVGGVLGALAS